MAENKTEKATPKKREEARKKGSVAKSVELNGAVVMMASLMALSAFGPSMLERMQNSTRQFTMMASSPDVVSRATIGAVLKSAGGTVLWAVLPVALVAIVAGVLTSVVQVGIKPMPGAIKPDPKKLNPLQGAKRIFGQHALFEGGKSIAKLLAVGAIAAAAVLPRLDVLAGLVGTPPAQLFAVIGSSVRGIFFRGAFAYLIIALIDAGYQRWKFEKDLRMDKQEVKDEYKQQQLPQEVRGMIRRRQMEAARRRMMDDVPTADVIVTNPTHYAVALRYDPSETAPRVVAKGTDLLAFKIRAIAEANDVPVIPNPPLARSLYAAVDIGHQIPEEFFAAVASVLAFVFRVAARRRAA